MIQKFTAQMYDNNEEENDQSSALDEILDLELFNDNEYQINICDSS